MSLSVARNFILGCIVLFVVSCGGNTRENTLGDLKYKPKKEKEIEISKLSHEQVRNEYKELLDLFEDKQLKEQIERRIADVYMMEGVQKQDQVSNKKSYYIEAIKEYEKILEKYPNSPDNAEVLYQLAKAYDMEGQTRQALKMLTRLTSRHPWYPNIAEAWFRKADIHFNYQEYSQAQVAYLAVTQSQNQKLWNNAHYMLGWCYYKQYQYDKSLSEFALVLEQHLQDQESTDNLDKTVKPVVDDTLHSISLALDKVGGAEFISDVNKLANQRYVWMVYKNLGDYYLEKELYGDSVSSYRAFVEKFKQSPRSPAMHIQLIEALVKGGFPKQALDEKALYVRAYGLYSGFTGKTDENKKDIDKFLRVYLGELASHFHSEGQAHAKVVLELEEKIIEFSDKKTKALEKKRGEASVQSVTAFNTAASHYRELIETFPNDPKVDETRFFLGEVLFAADRYEEAIKEYELVAYSPKGKSAEKHRPNAGYAAIISYQNLIQNLGEGRAAKRWQADAVESMLRFANKFHTDERSPAVLTNAAEYLFSLNQYEKAIEISDSLIQSNKELDKTLKKTAFGILAHSWFKLGNYVKAEESYLNQRALISKKDEEFKAVSERLAATIYKNSETLINAGETQQSIDELLKIKRLTPLSTRRVPAQYDAALLLIKLKKYPEAIVELKELNEKFSEHELAKEFPRKLASSYEQNGNWLEAASAYLALNKSDEDPEIAREALFLAASMYEKASNIDEAITTYKLYAYTYEEPFDTRMEARYKLALNYGLLKDDKKQQYWLRRLIEGHKGAGAKQTERSAWLAAWANIVYGDYYGRQFASKKLKQPIVASIAEKKKFLEQASDYYQAAANSQMLEYVTESGYKIAMLYQDLAADLRKAPPPSGLSAKDKELYKSIIEEQAEPFDNLATELYTANIQRAWDGEFNQWIDRSFSQLAVLHPERYAKSELIVSYGDEIR